MTMMEVDLPSGFYADEDSLRKEVKENENLAKYEANRRTIALYLQRVGVSKTPWQSAELTEKKPHHTSIRVLPNSTQDKQCTLDAQVFPECSQGK